MDEYDDYDDYEAAIDAVDEKVTGDIDTDVTTADDTNKRCIARKKMIDDIERERLLDY